MTRFRTLHSQLILALGILVWCSVCPRISLAQAVFGVIRGSVVDSSGLPVAGAKVTALNQNTREIRTVSTDATGNFVFPAMIPAPYTVAVEMAGFKKYEKSDAVLTAQARLEVGRLALEVGQVTESVQVTAAPTPVQTASSERSSVITAQQAAQLPILSRNISHYLTLIPGAVSQSWRRD